MRAVATDAEIDDALECSACNEALDWHLERCRPNECAAVGAWAAEAYEPRAAAMAALGAGDAHGPEGCELHPLSG